MAFCYLEARGEQGDQKKKKLNCDKKYCSDYSNLRMFSHFIYKIVNSCFFFFYFSFFLYNLLPKMLFLFYFIFFSPFIPSLILFYFMVRLFFYGHILTFQFCAFWSFPPNFNPFDILLETMREKNEEKYNFFFFLFKRKLGDV